MCGFESLPRHQKATVTSLSRSVQWGWSLGLTVSTTPPCTLGRKLHRWPIAHARTTNGVCWSPRAPPPPSPRTIGVGACRGWLPLGLTALVFEHSSLKRGLRTVTGTGIDRWQDRGQRNHDNEQQRDYYSAHWSPLQAPMVSPNGPRGKMAIPGLPGEGTRGFPVSSPPDSGFP